MGGGLPDVWGATPSEVATRTPADALIDEPRERWVRAVSSAADPATLWRWVCQLTVAPYSYDVIDNVDWSLPLPFVGSSSAALRLPFIGSSSAALRLPRIRRSPRTLTPGADDLRVGQRLLILFVIDSFAAGEHLTLRLRRPGRGLLGEFAMTYRVVGEGPRLVCTVVVGGAPGLLARAVRRALAWGDLVMMRRQLRTLADLAAGG